MYPYRINFANLSESAIREYNHGRLRFFQSLWLQARAARNAKALQHVLASIDYFNDVFPPMPLELNRHGNFASCPPHGHIDETTLPDTGYGVLQAGH